jgi:spermidine/putrescine transport system substrate-binding protein
MNHTQRRRKMSKQEEALELLSSLSKGQIERRAFVKQALGLGLSMASIGSLLAACGAKEQPKPTPKPTPKPDVTPNDAKPVAAVVEIPKPEAELVVYNWSDYIAEDTVPNFEKEFGVKVVYGNYENNEEILAKIQAGASGIDLICPSGYAGQSLIAQGLIEKLTMAWIPNAVNIAPQFRSTDFDPKNEYTIPWQWGRTGIAYRKDKVTTPPDSWAAFLNPEYKGKMTMMDDMRDVIGSWLKYRGKSVNSVNVDDLAQAKVDSIASKKNLQSYISASVKGQLIAGDVVIAQLWDGDSLQAQAEQPNIEWVMPKEGASFWIDSMIMPKGAPHPNAAHAFLNYILRPDVGASISNATGYGSPNSTSQGKIKRPVPFPTPEQARVLEVQKDLGAGNQLWDQIWTEIKAS